MRPLALLWGCLLLPVAGSEELTGPKRVRGFEGGSVSLQCTYSERLRGHKKYWCRRAGVLLPRCSSLVYAGEDGQERTEGRVSIQDHPQKLTLNVTLSKLTLEDSGDYWCGITILGFDEKFLVSLLVLPGTPPGEERPPHQATSPHAGTSQPPTYRDAPSTKGTKPRESYWKVRILAPVLVLLTLLLATGLALVGRCLLRCRQDGVPGATETEKNEKVHLSHVSRLAPEYAVVNLAAPSGPPAGPERPYAEIQDIGGPGQTLEEAEASSRDPAGEASPGPPSRVSEEELRSSVFIPV